MVKKEKYYALINFLENYTTTHDGSVHSVKIRLKDVKNYFDNINDLEEIIVGMKSMLVSEKGMSTKQRVILDFQKLPTELGFEVTGVTTEKLNNYKEWLNVYELKKIVNDSDKINIVVGVNYDSLEISYQNKRVKLRSGKNNSSKYLNICLLLFGVPLSYKENSTDAADGKRPNIFLDYPDYKIGKDKVDYDVVYRYAFVKNEDEIINLKREKKNKKVYDGIKYLNKKISKELFFILFKYSTSDYWVNKKLATKINIRNLNDE